MEFDKSIKTNNVKFEFVKEYNDKKDKKIKKNKTKKTGTEGFMSNIKEGFISEENQKIFEFKLTDFNIFTFIILSVLIPVIGINGIILFHRYASFTTYNWNGIAQNEKDDDTGEWYASNIYNKFREDGLHITSTGGKAGMFSAIISGWVASGEKGSQIVSQKI